MDWHISHFYVDLASGLPQATKLDVMQLDFELRSSRTRSYRVSTQLGHIEPVGHG
jgi:hypothetical protein